MNTKQKLLARAQSILVMTDDMTLEQHAEAQRLLGLAWDVLADIADSGDMQTNWDGWDVIDEIAKHAA